jgi:hypothetical protein
MFPTFYHYFVLGAFELLSSSFIKYITVIVSYNHPTVFDTSYLSLEMKDKDLGVYFAFVLITFGGQQYRLLTC